MKIDPSVSAIVTGGASGLGLATVRALRDAGARVAIFDMNEETGRQAAEATGAAFVKCDVSTDDSVDAAFATARAVNGQERVLVCCAGGGNAIPTVRRDKATGEIRMFPSDQFERVLKLNTVGTFRCVTRAAAGMMTLDPVDGERGVLINTASAAATEGQMGQAAYSAAKAGIVGMTLTIARDLAREAIRVCTIQPGIFDTPAMARVPAEMKQALGAMVPFPPRLGAAEEYAGLALEIVRNGYLNGTTIRLDGAIRMQPR
ncbi:SDR family NAD(P)-dependent oxidoreductase [Nitrospirillum iridis]|uniref:NAD(P)-dependent dehydrogenase (Short-subunit alcohol dehydrogenase family) n=1 Tax=Nitrospirillum iridis TaxID=765888 RepID=A0A7X0B062_9PROT|nr:SDR family NAD(P)-dependent oxidoreductase [Nitrospirillum iridis]MBB6253357.1 NAD(P)-dependent dehydrogenase (short-subunit alcohol dehydrogenase family) [Nitrospirillum iridis]